MKYKILNFIITLFICSSTKTPRLNMPIYMVQMLMSCHKVYQWSGIAGTPVV